MVWNYRIVKYKDGKAYGLHEVYYNEAGEACGMTAEPTGFCCDIEEGPESIIEGLTMALKDAQKHPVFDEPEVWAKWDGIDDDNWVTMSEEEFSKLLSEDEKIVDGEDDAGC
jgi:hypothetical protein